MKYTGNPAELSPEYKTWLQTNWNPELAQQFGEVHQAPIESDSQDTLAYVRGGEAVLSPNSVVILPGFTEDIESKLPFAIELAAGGFDVTLFGQERRKLVRDQNGRKNATRAQAETYLAALDALDLPVDQPVDMVTRSYASLILETMVQINPSRFQNSKIIMLAPGASNVNESLLRLGKRFVQHMKHEASTEKDYHDDTGDMMKAGIRNMRTSPGRAWREVREMAHDRIDYSRLLSSGIASLAVLGYAEDRLFTEDTLKETMSGAQQARQALRATGQKAAYFSYSTPYSTRWLDDGTLRGGKDSSHNDEQFNPSRVASAVAELLQN